MLERDMDINAGAHGDGISMDALGASTLHPPAVAGGQRSKGEKAGHAQVQIWRNWLRKWGCARGSAYAPAPDGYVMRPDVMKYSAVEIEALRNGPLDQRPRGTDSANQFVFRTDRSHDCRTLNERGLGSDHGISRLLLQPTRRAVGRGTTEEMFSLYG